MEIEYNTEYIGNHVFIDNKKFNNEFVTFLKGTNTLDSYNKEPAFILYFENDKPRRKVWYKNGKPHREEGPASLLFFKTVR